MMLQAIRFRLPVELDVERAMVEAHCAHRALGERERVGLRRCRQARRVLEALERARAGVHHGVDDTEEADAAAIHPAVDVDLHAVEQAFREHVLGVHGELASVLAA